MVYILDQVRKQEIAKKLAEALAQLEGVEAVFTPDRFAEIAAEFVRLKVDMIVTSGNSAIAAAKQATSVIPIVFAIAGDPVGTGLVENLGLGSDIWFGARAIFCEGTIQPKLDLIGQALTRDLGRRYGEDVVITFGDCSPRNPAERRADDELDARTGLRTYNEIRRGRGLQPYPDPRFDEPFAPALRSEGSASRLNGG